MRKPKITDFESKVASVFEGERTTIEERKDIALKWCLGDFESYVKLAHKKNLLPIALIVGALIDIEHPVLIDRGRLITKTMEGCAAIVLRYEFSHKPVDIPVEKPVDNLWITQQKEEIEKESDFGNRNLEIIHKETVEKKQG